MAALYFHLRRFSLTRASFGLVRPVSAVVAAVADLVLLKIAEFELILYSTNIITWSSLMQVELLLHWNSESLQLEAGEAKRQSCKTRTGRKKEREEEEEEEEKGEGNMAVDVT